MIRLAPVLTVAAFVGLGFTSLSAETYTPGEPVVGKFEDAAEDFLYNYCIDCHDDADPKGDLNLEKLGAV